jgi:hypothetical protein
MDDAKVKMPADGSHTKTMRRDELGELATRRDSDMPGPRVNTGESGGGPYPNPDSGRPRAATAAGRALDDLDEPGDKGVGDAANPPAEED